MPKDSIVQISFTDYSEIGELDQVVQKLLGTSKQMAEQAYAPYSNFKVGAAVLLEDGRIIGGNNQENRAFPSGLCAERVALFSASSQNPNMTILSIGIFADMKGQISPCGACRQVLLEYEEKQQKPIEMFLLNGDGEVRRFKASSDLLPFGFKFKNFNKD